MTSGAYPAAPQSYLLENHSGTFFDVTNRWSPQLQQVGMITDALWSDFDGDGKPDLVLTGEWMAPTFLKNTGTAFVSLGDATGIAADKGWWNSLAAGDFDNDGDIDYIAGNLGLNSNYKATPAEPMILYAKDLDDNGLLDAMVFCYMKGEDGVRKPFPMTSRDDMASQMISVRKRYPSYKSYGLASIDDLWKPKDRENALMLQTTDMASCYIENLGNGKFRLHPLPAEAQIAPVYGLDATDIDGDGNLDLLMVGNDYGMEPYSGRHDAFMGLVLKGDGKGGFTPLSLPASGFYVKGDAKGLARLHTARNEDIWIATQNQDSLVTMSLARAGSGVRWIDLQPEDFSADVVTADGKTTHMEFYYGSTYLSQSSRKIPVGRNVKKIMITDFKGKKGNLHPERESSGATVERFHKRTG
ncbi:FG-GAP repeat domain-containing protein [Puia sp. P3]|uniref:FG-GAP repeat domain-containing protein n=1 Tax=Puia sp. P3 TaxID=3423952 RepID=UPI003D66FE2F